MTDLSPAAQAVIDAVVAASPRLREKGIHSTRSPLIAAALRAAASKCAGLPDGRDCTDLLRNIATELESHQ